MGSFSKLTYHLIFATLYRQKSIGPETKNRLYEVNESTNFLKPKREKTNSNGKKVMEHSQ